MEENNWFNWKIILAAGIAVASVILSVKVKKEDSPLVLTNVMNKSKTAIIGPVNNL